MKQLIVEGIVKWIRSVVPELHVYDMNPEQDLIKPCAIVEETYSYVDVLMKHKEQRVAHDLSLYQIKIIGKNERHTRSILDTLRLSLDLIDCEKITMRPYGITSNMSYNNQTNLQRIGFLQFYVRTKFKIKSPKPYIMNELDLNIKAQRNG